MLKTKIPLRDFCFMWTRQDSNPPPPRCKRGALPDELLALEAISNFQFSINFEFRMPARGWPVFAEMT